MLLSLSLSLSLTRARFTFHYAAHWSHHHLQPFVISNKSIKWKPKKTLTKFLHIFNENKVTYYCSIADLFFLSFLLFWWTPSSLFAFKPNCQIQSNTFHGKWEINLHSNINLTLHHPDLFLLLSKCLYLYSNFSI